MNDLNARIANLSPEKRKLLELLRQKQGQQNSDNPSEEDVIRENLFSFEDGELPEKGEVKSFYDALNSQLSTSQFGEYSFFLNYGYVPNSNPQFSQVRLPDVYLNKNSTRLVLEVIGDCELGPDTEVLDVGCGRGGTVYVFRKFFNVGRVTGGDLSSNAVRFCQKVHTYPDTFFKEADAENLPFEDQSFDIVTNLESSHTYGDLFAFYKEVWRVLRPGGNFLYTDLIPDERIGEYQEFLENLGFVTEHTIDITSNVLLSCDEMANVHSKAFTKENDSDIMANFLAVPNSPVYNEMKNGKTRYLLFRFHKKE